jgi:BirA family biotin operon repressor/biotin-[acetyl-CoA-carboxylase] ligase
MDRRLMQWNGGAGFAATRAAWLERAGPAGEACSVNMGAEVIAGAFAGLDDSGALLIVDDAGRGRTVAFGDVSLPAAAEAGAA